MGNPSPETATVRSRPRVDVMRSSFAHRVLGAARLDPGAYEEVEADRSALPEAALVVLISCVATGIGTPGIGHGDPQSIAISTLAAVVGWIAWAALTCVIGVRLLPTPDTRADVGQLLRTIGFSSAPGALRIFGILPVVGPLVFMIVSVWMLIAMVVAVRQALDYTSTMRALAVCLAGWLLSMVMAVVIGIVFAPTVS